MNMFVQSFNSRHELNWIELKFDFVNGRLEIMIKMWHPNWMVKLNLRSSLKMSLWNVPKQMQNKQSLIKKIKIGIYYL